MIVRNHSALLTDYVWETTARYGRTVVTYAMPDALADYTWHDQSVDPAFFQTFFAVRGHVADVARQAMQIWEDVGNIQLVEVSPGRSADIMLGTFDFDLIPGNVIGFAFHPAHASFPLGGDVFIDRDYQADRGLWLHEIGHALGLGHPHEGSITLDSSVDTTAATVMSYSGEKLPDLGYLDADALAAMYPGRISRDVVASEYELRTRPATDVFRELRDFDGNDLGGDGDWHLIGATDADGDGQSDLIAVNETIGRWAALGVGDDGLIDFSDHGKDGSTRVVGIYVDPLITQGDVVPGSDFDSQRRFTNDLKIGNLDMVIGSGDFDGDGLQELYFALEDKSAVLHAYMHADGNIRYANYQTEDQAAGFLDANGVRGYADWLFS